MHREHVYRRGVDGAADPAAVTVMATRHELSQRHPDIVFTSVPPGVHGAGAVGRVSPIGTTAPTMWAYADVQAERYARVVARVSG
ncbi:hypothetical protein [Nocardiopsis sp. CA-288880]|uniref:hypothetical protein n=1 Tax=Nocardiopsis sp. CA-288880 TaxID=3239995 RepID=UPI003D97351C